MKRTKLVFGAASTQPVGATDDEIEDAYQRAYKPFLKTLYNAPDIPSTLFFSGHLLTWLEKHHSEYTDVLSEMIDRKQVEILGGGFYDPVFTIIPRPDRIGQVESLTTLLRKRFGRRPRGSWVTEHIWEPSLASTMNSSGMDFVFLDDNHFQAAGLTGDLMYRPCLTEDQGKTIVVFPVCHELVRMARDKSPEDVIAFLKSKRSDDPSRLVVLIDNGERFRGTFGDGKKGPDSSWLSRMLHLMQENREWLNVELPSALNQHHQPQPRGYFASAFFDKSTGSVGGCFRHNITRYPESNLMYAKMQYIHILVNQIRGDKYRKQAAREELWKGQCHTAYWHGSHEGIYSNRLRKQVYCSLIEAEKKTRERGIFRPSIVTVDFDMDGVDEYLFQGQEINAYVHECGGTLFELDYLPRPWNYLDTLSRHREKYHSAEVASAGYDLVPRRGFVDHFLNPKTTLSGFEAARGSQQGSFESDIYKCISVKRDSHVLQFRAEGTVDPSSPRNGNGRGSRSRPSSGKSGPIPVTLEKRYQFKRSSLDVEYTITNNGEQLLSTIFTPELNLSFLSQEPDHLRMFARSGKSQPRECSPEMTEHTGVAELRLDDIQNEVSITVGFGADVPLWTLPVMTMGRGPEGVRARYQSSSILPRWSLALQPGESTSAQISLKIDKS